MCVCACVCARALTFARDCVCFCHVLYQDVCSFLSVLYACILLICVSMGIRKGEGAWRVKVREIQ